MGRMLLKGVKKDSSSHGVQVTMDEDRHHQSRDRTRDQDSDVPRHARDVLDAAAT